MSWRKVVAAPQKNEPDRIKEAIRSTLSYAERRDRVRKDILVIAVHGFNTRGEWKNRLSLLLTKETDGERFLYAPWDYGEFRFGILNPLARGKQVVRFQEFYNDLLNQFRVGGEAMPDIVFVAHSFGTYIVGHALRRFPEVKCKRLLLLGSALPRSFEWKDTLGRKVDLVLNILGGSDLPLLLASSIPGLGLGGAGRHGFKKKYPELREIREPYSDHSDVFGNDYMRTVWIPFFRNGTVPS